MKKDLYNEIRAKMFLNPASFHNKLIYFRKCLHTQGGDVYKRQVDGQSVKADTVDGALLHIPLSAGMHTVEMYFIPQGFVLGAVISGLSCLIFVVIYFRKLRRKTGQ